MGWSKINNHSIWIRNNQSIPNKGKFAIFDLFGTVFFSAPDKPFTSGRKIKMDELIDGYPNIESFFVRLKSQGWIVLFVARNADQGIVNSFPEWIDYFMIGREVDMSKTINGYSLTPASFYVYSYDPVFPEEALTGITENNSYRGWEMFDKWPGGSEGPSVRPSGSSGRGDLIVFVGASGSGRDEGLSYLTGIGYQEVRRTGKYVDRIRRDLAKGNRIVFNATNPKSSDRREVLNLHPEARIWWFARPGREFAGGRVPEAAYTRFSREFEVPSGLIDRVPVIRLT